MSAQDTLLAEIAEQPEAVARVLDRQRTQVQRVAEAIRAREPEVVVLVARGSSDNAAIYGRYLLEIANRRLTSLAAPSTVTLYERGPRLERTVVIGVSQSGRGEDVVTYVRQAREQGALTAAIVNDASSPLAGTAEYVLECLAGPEVSVPATKSVTTQMALFAALSAALDETDGTLRGANVEQVPQAIEAALGQRDALRALAQRLNDVDAVSVVGRGYAFPAALEIALKLKETSYTLAEPFSAADFFHGPVALVEEAHAGLLIDVGGRSTAPALHTAHEVQARGGRALLLRAGRVGSDPAGIPCAAARADVDEPFAPIAVLVLGQLLAFELALARGLDPSQPRGLRKVTSTR